MVHSDEISLLVCGGGTRRKKLTRLLAASVERLANSLKLMITRKVRQNQRKCLSAEVIRFKENFMPCTVDNL